MKKQAYDYFEFFGKMAEQCFSASQALVDLLTNYEYDSLEQRKQAIHVCEHTADSLKHDMTATLLREFLPPFDREDIVMLATRMDDIIDCIDDVALALYMYDIHTCREDVLSFAAVISGCCGKLQTLVADLSKYKRVRDELLAKIVEVHHLEADGDACHTQAMRTLFTDGTDGVSVCAWKDIYDRLEECCDSCERAADAVEHIILKNT